MKGYDAVVFPREGEPVADLPRGRRRRTPSARPGRATFGSSRGYDESDPRPPSLRALDLARQRVAELRARRARALARDAGGRPHGRRADDLHRRRGSTRSRDAADATPLLAEARAIKTDAGDRADAARERDRRGRDGARAGACSGPGMTRGAGRAPSGTASSTATGTGWEGKVELALGFSLVWSGPGIRTFTATGDRPVVEGRADALRDLGLRRRLLVRPHEEPRPGRARPRATRELEAAADGASTTTRSRSARPGASLAELDRRVRAGHRRDRAIPGQPSHPICHGVGARAHEPPYAHQAGGGTIEAGMVLAIEPGCYWEGGGGLRVEDNFLITDDGRREALAASRTGSCRRDLDRAKSGPGDLNERRSTRSRTAPSASTTRRCATASRRSASSSTPEDKLEIARALDEAGSRPDRGGLPARLRGRLARRSS